MFISMKGMCDFEYELTFETHFISFIAMGCYQTKSSLNLHIRNRITSRIKKSSELVNCLSAPLSVPWYIQLYTIS